MPIATTTQVALNSGAADINAQSHSNPALDPQRTSKMWQHLLRTTPALTADNALSTDEAPHNATGIAYPRDTACYIELGNQDGLSHKQFIHANNVVVPGESSPCGDEDEPSCYVVGQSPQPSSHQSIAHQSVVNDSTALSAACENSLIVALNQNRSIFQASSPKALKATQAALAGNAEPVQLNDVPIALQLHRAWAHAKQNNQSLHLGADYKVVGFEPISFVGEEAATDHLCFSLTIERKGKRGNIEHTEIKITQTGLSFTDKVMTPKSIHRANVLYEQTKAIRNSNSQGEPMLLSYAGVGRSATVMVYNELLYRIQHGIITSKEHLDWSLRNVIDQGRKCRGPRFIHSVEQLHNLRIALSQALEQSDQQGGMDNLSKNAGASSKPPVLANALGQASSVINASLRRDLLAFFTRGGEIKLEDLPEIDRQINRATEIVYVKNDGSSLHAYKLSAAYAYLGYYALMGVGTDNQRLVERDRFVIAIDCWSEALQAFTRKEDKTTILVCHPLAQYALACLCLDGTLEAPIVEKLARAFSLNRPTNNELAFALLSAASESDENGNMLNAPQGAQASGGDRIAQAQNLLGLFYLSGTPPATQDDARAAQLFRAASTAIETARFKSADAAAMTNLAWMLQNGKCAVSPSDFALVGMNPTLGITESNKRLLVAKLYEQAAKGGRQKIEPVF